MWETGLGGRLDATNIVTPAVCIITNIGLDHQQYLGGTLAEIAAEKAGIIKPGVPLVSGVVPGEAADVIFRQAQAAPAPLMSMHRDMKVEDIGIHGSQQLARIDGREYPLRLWGAHQVSNAACAVAMMNQMGYDTERNLRRGLESASWPGRFEILSERPLAVIDGAHNSAGMTMLVETWRAFLTAKFDWKSDEINGRARLVFASVADKDISEMTQLLRPITKEVALVQLGNERGAAPRQLAPAFAGLPVTCYDSVADVWQSMEQADPSSVTLITGSLFLVGEMLARRQGISEEYRLNERLEKPTATR